MQRLLDVLVSGVHDAKNQLFIAESLIAAQETRHGVDLGEARYAIEAAAGRLSRLLSTYRLFHHEARLAIVPTIVADLCEEVRIGQQAHLTRSGKTLTLTCEVIDEWALDRDLVLDMLNNAVQNAGRHARATIHLSVREDDGGLCFRIDDDGEGFAELPPLAGTGLLVAGQLAALHQRRGRPGRLHLGNDSALGGARFELWLP